MTGARLALLCVLVAPASALAQNFEFEFTESALNRIVEGLRSPSDGGVYERVLELPGFQTDCMPIGYFHCPLATPALPGVPVPPELNAPIRIPLLRCRRSGQYVISPGFEPITWQWFVTDARFDIKPGGMSFSASVRYRVGDAWYREDRTVGASMKVNTTEQALEIDLNNFEVPIQLDVGSAPNSTITVDVDKIMSVRIPLPSRSFESRRLDGESVRTITTRIASGSVQYLSNDRIRVMTNVQYSY